MKISEISITPIKPKNGIVAFANFVLDDSLYMGSIAVMTKLSGGFRLSYPSRILGNRNIQIFHPINKRFAQAIEENIVTEYENVMRNSLCQPNNH